MLRSIIYKNYKITYLIIPYDVSVNPSCILNKFTKLEISYSFPIAYVNDKKQKLKIINPNNSFLINLNFIIFLPFLINLPT